MKVAIGNCLRQVLLCLCLPGVALPLWAEEPVRVGVLANRPSAQVDAKWQPLAVHLERLVPGRRFVLVALDVPQLDAAVASRQLDFVLTQPAQYVSLAHRYGLTSPLATLISNHEGKALQAIGGVVVARADRADLARLQDLRGRTVAAVGTESIGGHLAQAYELERIRLRQPKDYRLLVTGMPQDKVVEAVLEGRADAGFLRSGILEAMAAEGRLNAASLKVLNRQDTPAFPQELSTRLYPEWPVAALPHTPEDLMRKVTTALLSVEEHPAAVAIGIHGFTVPANYGAVEKLMRELRAPPFDEAPAFTWGDVWQRYSGWLSAVAAAMGAILLLTIRLHLSRRRLEEEKIRAEVQAGLVAEERRRLGDIIEATRAGTWEWNVQTGEAKSNERWAEITGHSLEELAPLSIQTWIRLVHPDDLQNANRLLERHFSGELEHYVCELRMRHKDGHWVWVMDRGQVVSRMGDGKPLLVSGTHQDITDRKRAEEALRRNEERLSLVMEATADGIWDFDPVARQTYFSDHFVAHLGYGSRGEMKEAFHISDALHPEDRDRVLRAMQCCMEEGIAFDETYRLRRADGRYRWFQGRGMPVMDEAGCALRFIGAISDIEEMKQNEQRIVDLNRTLEERVRQRTAELETALHELEDFSYAASHDLRAPLRAVDGFAQILGEEYAPRLDDAAQGYLTRIRAASRHLSEVIDNMIELMHVTRIPLEMAEVDLSAIGRRLLGELQARSGRTITIQVADGLAARADADLIAVALRNLVQNAWKFTSGTPDARIELGTTRLDGESVFFVADNGAGFDPAFSGRLFRPFFRLHRPGEFPGAGIGLAIVQRIIRRHGGGIWATAAPGKGATFYFTLPAA